MVETELSTETDLVVSAVRALPVLPADAPGDRYGVRALTAAWLAECRSPNTRRAYFGDLAGYLSWCQREGLDPLRVRPVDGGRFKVSLAGAADTTVNRKLTAVSSWYRYLLLNLVDTVNPITAVKRPKVDKDASVTVGLTVEEVKLLLRVADQRVVAAVTPREREYALRDRAVVRCLTDMGMRRAEVVALDLDSLSYNRGYRTVRYQAKGGKVRERALPGHLLHALDEYLLVRGDEPGPLFVTRPRGGGAGRLHDARLFELVRGLAVEAKLPAAQRLSPHGLRHTFATNARELGISLEDVQDALGHADPRTTRRYDRARHALHREPGLRLGELYTDEEEF